MVPPIESEQELVQAAVACGFAETEIADRLGITLTALGEKFPKQLRCAEFDANLSVLRGLLFLATERLHPGAALFWAKMRCGWSEKSSSKIAEEELFTYGKPLEFRVHRNDDEPNHID